MLSDYLSWLPGGVVGAIVGLVITWRKTNNESMSIKTDGEVKVSKTILEYAETLRRDIQSMKIELDVLEKQIMELKTKNLELLTANEAMYVQVLKLNEEVNKCTACRELNPPRQYIQTN